MRRRRYRQQFSEALAAIVTTVAAFSPFFLMLAMTFYALRALCPSQTLACDLTAPALTFGGLVFSCICVDVLLFSLLEPWRWLMPLSRPIRLALVAVAALAFGAWIEGLFTHYCATSQNISVNNGLFSAPTTYSWNDVKALQVGCTTGRHSWVLYDLRMSDGSRIGLGGRAWSMTLKHHREIAAALSDADYNYDTWHTLDCSDEQKKQLFEGPR